MLERHTTRASSLPDGIGAVRIERANVRVYIPVVSILLTSVAATIVLTILGFLFRR
jgi:hypothetical protein